MRKFICMLLCAMLICVPFTGLSAVDDISLSASFKNYKGEILTALKNANYVDVEVKIENQKTTNKNATVIIALYRGDEILRIAKATNKNLRPNIVRTYKTGIALPKDKTNLKIKTFVLDEENKPMSREMVLQ